jgi:pyruvate,water dikinase
MILPFDAVTDADAARVGGKGLSLGKTANAGLPVPPGFVVTTEAYRKLHAGGIRGDAAFASALADAYRNLGGGPVAVRSSATAEDGAEFSFAGQQETILGVVGVDALVDAVERCWKSLHTERAIAYRRLKSIPDDGMAMAVVVQQLVPADVAGVLFTRDPQDASGNTMAVEASWGLGEAVVSGRVTPDRFRVDRASGMPVEKHAGRKTVRITAAGEEPVPEPHITALCLGDNELSRLAELGRKVEAFYGDPRDIEWAIAGGSDFLLQARPITTASAADREAVRTAVISGLRAKADPRETVWVRYNLSEVLPEPTPMTWAVVGRLLAADGGFGAMNRDLGATPDPTLGSDSAFDLVAGRPMVNLSKLPRMQFRSPPIEYPFAAYKADPKKALDPKPVLNPGRNGKLRGLLRLPLTIWELFQLQAAPKQQIAGFAERFAKELAPAFAADARKACAQDWSKLDSAAVRREFETWVNRTLVEFARHSLKPTVFADLSWTTLLELLKPALGEDRARSAVGEIALGAHPPADADFTGGIRRLAAGELDRAAFLEAFGHRARNEMELSVPRWNEDPAAVDQLAKKPENSAAAFADSDAFERIATEAKLTGAARDAAKTWADRLRTYLGLRESGKHHLLLGYAVIRRALVELDRRFALNGGVFYLLPTELGDLLAGKDLSAPIAARRKQRQAELMLEVPAVLFSDDLEAIGRPVPIPEGATTLDGIPLSAGVAEGPALVLTEPCEPPAGAFVLVCPSTDPAWVPLFAKATALVMETGGVLSHGAIVAREFGLPAVAGLPDATKQIRTGQTVRVDGGRGTVSVV